MINSKRLGFTISEYFGLKINYNLLISFDVIAAKAVSLFFSSSKPIVFQEISMSLETNVMTP